MSPLRKRTLDTLLWLGLVALSIRPVDPVERLLDVAGSPLFLLGELASPLRLLRAPEVRAAQSRLSSFLDEEARASEDLLASLARHALPSDPALAEGRRLVHAEVIGRIPGSRDRLLVRLRDARGIEPGLPVASGDAFVGRVVGVDPADDPADGGMAEVELVTARGFFVGARTVDDSTGLATDMTVGGLDVAGRGPRRGGRMRLAVHNPSDRSLEGGFVRVHELLADVDPHARLAEGFRLGIVRRTGPDRWGIEPELDYLDGLFHVVVLSPAAPGLPSAEPMEQALADQRWVRARVLSHGDPSAWRESLKLAAGFARGIARGAAVAFGARIVGRIERVGPWSADVSTLGDPGLTVVAVARFDGVDAPHVLGRLVSLGRDGGGETVLLRWRATLPVELAPDAPGGLRRARLFTGSGDPGMPSGLYLGRALVPVGTEGGTVRLLAPPAMRHLGEVWVRGNGLHAGRGGRP